MPEKKITLDFTNWQLDILRNEETKTSLERQWRGWVNIFKAVESHASFWQRRYRADSVAVADIVDDPDFVEIYIALDNIKRWHRFLEVKARIRPHTVRQHTQSAQAAAHQIVTDLGWSEADVKFMSVAFACHDWGEALVAHGDVSRVEKQISHDLLECQAVEERLYRNGLAPEKADYIYQAFLLQFTADYSASRQTFADFSLPAKRFLDLNARSKLQSGLLFNFLEYWGYLIYGLEQYLDYHYPYILAQIIALHFNHMEKMGAQIIGLGKLSNVWTQTQVSTLRHIARHLVVN